MQDKRKRVLIFDDDYESMRQFKEHVEEETSWHIELTANKELLKRLKDERFDLVLVDIMIHPASPDAEGEVVENVHFPGVNWRDTGLAFLRRLREGEFSGEGDGGTRPDVPVIILSAVANYPIEEALGDSPANLNVRIVEKPFRLEEITRLLVKTLQE